MVSQFSFPKPETYEMLEDIAELYFSNWLDIPFGKMGHRGQAQHGIDLIGTTLNDGSYIIVQCKCHNDGKLIYNEILEEVTKVQSTYIKVNRMFFMTSAEADAKVQKKLAEAELAFHVDVIYWDTIEKWLMVNPDIASLLYMQSVSADDRIIKRFLMACIKYHIYEALCVFDITYSVPSRLLVESDMFEIEMDDAISHAAPLREDVLYDMRKFNYLYANVMQNFAISAHPTGNGYYGIAEFTEQERYAIMQDRQMLYDIYFKYKTKRN